MQSPGRNGQWIDAAAERFQRPLTLYAARIVGDADRARDVVQEAFAQLCKQREGEVSLPEWLYAVCRNRALDIRRKDRRMTQLDESMTETFECATAPDPAQQVQNRADTASVLELLNALPPNQQDAIRLKFQHGLSYKQIAVVMNQSVTNVGFLIHTSLKTIRRQMNPEK